MRLIVGLGNPGKRYQYTRHNIGFLAIDRIAAAYRIAVGMEGFKSLWGIGRICEKDILLIKPQTFMNKSGEAVKEIVDHFRIAVEDILVLYDDIDLPFGQIRIRRGGGCGGHHGMESISESIGVTEFLRIRAGIGRPEDGDITAYVLSPFAKDEIKSITAILDRIRDAVEVILSKGVDEAMNSFN